MEKYKIAIIIIIIIAVIGATIYFTKISPLVSKPYIEKPVLTYTENGEPIINETHIAWIVNELGSYKLSGSAEMELINSGQTYKIRVEDTLPIVEQGSASDPDVRIITDSDDIVKLMEADDVSETANQLYEEGELSVSVLKSQADLLFKGYMTIYNEITG